jgi:conjugal transfer mating pair stabilization protein TraG
MNWMIYGDLDFMADVLNGVALLTAGVGGAGGNFTGLLELALLIGGMAAIITALTSGGRINWLPLLGTFLVFMALLGPKRTVTMESVFTGQTRTVANIPLGVAFAGSVTTRIGLYLTETVETVFSFPGLTTDGFQESLETWRVLRHSALNPSTYGAANTVGGGDFSRSWINYVSTCTAFGMEIGTISPTAVENGQLAHMAVLNPNPALGAEVFLAGGVPSNLNCVQAHAQLLLFSRTQFIPALKNQVLTPLLFRQQREQVATVASVEGKITALRTLAGSAVSNDEFLLSLYVATLYDLGMQRRYSLDGMTDYSIMISDAVRARNAQWRAQGDLFITFVLPALGFFEGFFYAMLPIVIVIAALRGPAGVKTVGEFATIGMWIQVWAPVLSITNLYTFHAVAGDLANLDGAALVSTSVAGAFAADSVVQQHMGTAGMFAALAPLLALGVMKGSIYTLNTIASQLGGPDTISETTAARQQRAAEPIQVLQTNHGLDPVSGARSLDAASLLPTFQTVSTRSQSMESALRETAGARTAFLQSIDRAISNSSGSEGRSFSEGVFSDSTASRGSSMYQFMQANGLEDATTMLESFGLTRTEALNFTAGAAVNAGANGGKINANSALGRELSEKIGIENASQFMSRVNRSMRENEQSTAELATAISTDQRTGWSESGYTRSGFTRSEAVRESGERFAGAERSYQEAVSSAVSSGASQTVTTPYLSHQIASNPALMTAFENRLRDGGIFGEALRNADMYRSQNLFPEGRQGRDQALVAGGLKAMTAGRHEDLLDETLRPFGMEHVGQGNPAGYRGVSNDLGPGPTVNIPGGTSGGGGYAGRGSVPDAAAIVADHEARAGALRAEAEAQAVPMVQAQAARALDTQTRLEEDQSIPSAVAGRVSNYFSTTAGMLQSLFKGDQGWADHVDALRQDALSQGLTPAQAELYAYEKSVAGRIGASIDVEYRDSLVDNVLSEYEGLPRAGDVAVKMVDRAVGMTDAGARGVMGELKLHNQGFELNIPRDERGLVGRTVQ